jgi:hypothetical protein
VPAFPKLCHVKDEKFLEATTVIPPLRSEILVESFSRIVHQTWFEELSPEKYQYMSNYTDSVSLMGGSTGSTDEDAASFFEYALPPESLEAFHARGGA